MRFTQVPRPSNQDYHSPATSKLVAQLNKRIDTLTKNQDELVNEIQAIKTAPISDSQDIPDIRGEYLSLLSEEVAIRQALSEFYGKETTDRTRVSQKTLAELNQAKDSVLGDLLKMGYTPDSLKGSDIVARHPIVKALTIQHRELSGTEYSRQIANNDAIKYLEQEITRQRGRMVAV